MVFSSMVFLWIFLPIVMICYFCIDRRYKNILLLIASILFYAWGEPKYVLLLLSSVLLNYVFGLVLDKREGLSRKLVLGISVLANLSLLGYFKYFDFFARSMNALFFGGSEVVEVKNIVLPIGISFFTFQILSYIIDLYRRDIHVQKNIIDLALYVALFPQLIAGPIVRYHDIERQLKYRTESTDKRAEGIKRFIVGLAKKVLLSNALALSVDKIFAIPAGDLSASIAWTGALFYTLQIYFDFSGYSDMAIGLGKVFGFDFLENFNIPYVSKSIREFWRRWHISLSTWFREYLYIPLGGNRKGKARTYINLLIVFFMTGLWHGAGYTFILWGLFHGFFIVIERMFLGKVLEKNRLQLFNHLYTLFVVIIGWVLFRADSLSYAWGYLASMFGMGSADMYHVAEFVSIKTLITFIAGVLLCGVLQRPFDWIKARVKQTEKGELIWQAGAFAVLLPILMVCIVYLVSGTYNPFIYFRF